MLERKVSFNSIVLSFLKRVDSLSADETSDSISSSSNAIACGENRLYKGNNVKRLVLTDAKIAGIADIEIGLLSFKDGNKTPALFFEKVDFAMLSAVSTGVIELCKEGNYSCIENDYINAISNELSIIPRFSYPFKGNNQKDFPVSFFRGTFLYRYRISTGISVRRFLSMVYENATGDMQKDFRKIESQRSFSSFLSISLLRTFLDEKWCDKLLNTFCS